MIAISPRFAACGCWAERDAPKNRGGGGEDEDTRPDHQRAGSVDLTGVGKFNNMLEFASLRAAQISARNTSF
jgi:hypothetical protein